MLAERRRGVNPASPTSLTRKKGRLEFTMPCLELQQMIALED
jgi:hypothetical protein